MNRFATTLPAVKSVSIDIHRERWMEEILALAASLVWLQVVYAYDHYGCQIYLNEGLANLDLETRCVRDDIYLNYIRIE